MRGSAEGWTILIIVLVVTAIYLIAALLVAALRLPWDMSLPVPVRALGFAPIFAGAAMLGWLFRYRRFRDILVSTHATFLKIIGRAPLQERLDRTEPLVVAGPYRIVRHPMYSGIGMVVLGIGVLSDHTWALLGAVLACLWFAFGIGPFEERELKALFGRDYAEYIRVTPRILPIPLRRWRRG
jgi:protein-S-isoprenylcysteine O-methyltransferase Ste14